MIIDLTARYPVSKVWWRAPYNPLTLIDGLVIHHFDAGLPPLPASATQADEITLLDSIYAFHVQTRQFGGMGYHGVAFESGRAYLTADWSRWGAHVSGENDHLRGFAAAADYISVSPGLRLRAAFGELISRSDQQLGPLPLYGHRNWEATGCPGDALYPIVQQLRAPPPEEEEMMTPEQEALLKAAARDAAKARKDAATVLAMLKGGNLPGVFVKGAGPAIYFLAYANGILTRHHVPNPASYRAFGADGFILLSTAQLARLPEGPALPDLED